MVRTFGGGLNFATIPSVSGLPMLSQSTDGYIAESSRRHSDLLAEGDLVTGVVDTSNEQAHMIPAIRNPASAKEKKALVRVNLLNLWTIKPNKSRSS